MADISQARAEQIVGVYEERPVGLLPVLPEEFWQTRPSLRTIRQASRARMVSADAMLHADLARVSSMLPPSVRADAGRGPCQLCWFAAPVGPSGVGKTTAGRAAADLRPVPAHLQAPPGSQSPYVDGVPLGSGEGLAELFMGWVDGPDGKKVRGQARHRVLVVVDEGEALTALGQRRGSTAGANLRAAWAGATIGSAGANEHTTRIIPAGSYTLGMIVGYQMTTAQALVTDTGTGMAQRFVWASAVDPTISEDTPAWPDPLPNIWKRRELMMHTEQVTIGVPDSVTKWVRSEHAARQRGEVIIDPADSHEPLIRLRAASLLAITDGRLAVSEEDWQLAEVVWTTSRLVRDAVTEYGRREKAEKREIVAQAEVDLAERKAAVSAVADPKLQRLAVVLARHVVEAGGLTNGAARKTMSGRDKPLYGSVVEKAAAAGLITVSDSGLLPPVVKP